MAFRSFASAARSFTSSARQLEASTSTTPLRRTKDPLLSSPLAQHFTTPQGHTFIIRPPPSVLPPTLPHVPISTPEHLLPARRSPAPQTTSLSAAQVGELQALRRANPQYWTRGRLGDKFGVSQRVVGTLGWGEGAEGRAAERARREECGELRERKEGSRGWKKAIAREERRRRRTMW